jgi:hypothetical protein
MHPVLIRQLATDHSREMHANAEDGRPGRQARRARRQVSTRPRLPASDDPRLDAGQRPAIREQPSVPPLPVMAGTPPDRQRHHTTRSA